MKLEKLKPLVIGGVLLYNFLVFVVSFLTLIGILWLFLFFKAWPKNLEVMLSMGQLERFTIAIFLWYYCKPRMFWGF